jgi:hypothetical protein
MTVGLLIDRLERFRQEIVRYRELCKQDNPLRRSGSDFTDSSEREALRDKLCQQFSLLDEYVKGYSLGRYQIHLDARGQQDIYVHALAPEGTEWHLEIVLDDLEQILAGLRERPSQQPVALYDRGQDSQAVNLAHSFGALGHLGHSSMPNTPANLHAVLSMMSRIIQQRITRPEEKEKLQAHLHAILAHHGMADLLPLSPSQLL